MSDAQENAAIQFYTVCFPEYDSWGLFHGRLYQVRRDFFETRLASQETTTEFSEGMPAKYSHAISRWGMRWKKKLGGRLREMSCFDAAGSAILFQDNEGCAYAKQVFGRDHNWLRSEYYKKGDPALRVRFSLRGDPAGNTVTLKEHRDGEEPILTQLVARPFLPGTVEQSLLNAKLGEPRVCAATSRGDFCYYDAATAQRYDELLARFNDGRESLAPAWKQDPLLPGSVEPDWYRETPPDPAAQQEDLTPLEQLGSLRGRLLEGDGGALASPFALDDKDLERDLWVEDLLVSDHRKPEEEPDDFLAAGKPHQEPPAEERYAARREVFRLEAPVQEEPQGWDFSQIPTEPTEDVREIIDIIERIETEHPAPKKEPAKPPAVEVELHRTFPRGELPQRYTVAGKTLHSGVIHAAELFQKPAKAPPAAGARRIVVSAQDGGFCLSQVLDRLSRGVGIAYSAQDGTIFVGNWKNNIPTGEGKAFDQHGNLRYSGGWKEGKRHGAGTEFAPDGSVLFTGQWRDDKRCTAAPDSCPVPPRF